VANISSRWIMQTRTAIMQVLFVHDLESLKLAEGIFRTSGMIRNLIMVKKCNVDHFCGKKQT